ncbi:ADP-ribosylglycohydrolase family protein [Geomonas sp. RF6]|uniref:ADP-ribosylglycohydrolase family protein n=1 Tax=Geomonas sp. RF6 TaxID=2897342 RepID=UPI001E52E50E|nr:ADP-ribosylglycohydrolase family protein [Geomonas sp. RF6]UFS71134.1 ADP-ribosylglycohydrolase family protein [Geomonas sp. RF6]
MHNGEILEELFRSRRINLHKGKIFRTSPRPLPTFFEFSRIEGMMLGLAIGDALGNTNEGLLRSERRERFGEIRDFLPNRYAHGRRLGLPSDDTQISFWTIETLLEDRVFIPSHLAARFCRGEIFGIGSTAKAFIWNLKAGKPWYESGPVSAGNGALLQIPPMLLPHLHGGCTDLWIDTALSAMITHNDSASNAACMAFVAILWDLLGMVRPPPPHWWPQRYAEVAADLEGESRYSPRGGMFPDYVGPCWRYTVERVTEALHLQLTTGEACDGWFSGAFLMETMPSVLYIMMRHGDDPEEAIVRAVNDTKDNDTIAAIVGALAGALHGREGLPKRWLDRLPGRTGASDDGKAYLLLKCARQVFWEDVLSERGAITR